MGYPAEKKVKYTYEDYLKTPDNKRYELIEGELIMVPAPRPRHQRISLRLTAILEKFIEDNSSGEILYAPCDIVFDEENVLQPDILFVSNERQEIITEDNIKGAPDLVIEILSPSTAYFDLVKKKKIYAKFGVKEYWIVDPEEKTVEVYLLEKDSYKLTQSFTEGNSLTSEMFSGLSINLNELFR
jgi:Uma2 family endonuclease